MTDLVGIAAVVTAVTAAALGALGFWRSRGIDATAKESADDAAQAASALQVVRGLESIIGALQSDNKYLRDNQDRLYARIDVLEKRIVNLENGKGGP